MTKSTTMPAVASGGSTVPATFCKISNGCGSDSLISTGIGRVGSLSPKVGLGATPVSGVPAESASSFSKPVRALVALSKVAEDSADLRSLPILSASAC